MTKARRSSRPVIAGIALALLAGFCAAPTITAWGQQPASGRANRLINSANPYLLQHARNPVDWYPWGPEAIARAKGENKPIFLSVGYSTCYWCHVAERTVYANPAIAALMNEWFVNVKVDREERPDIDDTYMAARRQLTGSGGWPNNVFLTPDLKPFFAAGHIPPEGEGGKPGFARVIRLIHERWDKSQSQLQAIASQTHAALVGQRASGEAAASALPAPAEWLAKAREQILRRRDVLSGGIDTGSGARFPLPPLLELLLTDYRRNGTPESLQAVAEALGAMAFGGIHDHLAGGIHRYSTEPTWSVPHFEKMLYDNAQLLGLYADLYAITRRPLARAMGADIARYLSRRMMAPEGGFFTAENADIDGKEGATYLWTRAEILGAIGPAEENRFFAVYDLAPMPTSIAGRGVLRVRMDRGSTAKDQTEIERELAALAPLRAKLLKVRDRRAQPDRDDKIIVGLNGLAIEALARAGKLLAEPQWIDWARRSAELLWQHAFEERTGRLRRHIYKGEVRGEGFLEDYALLGRGLLALGEANGDPIWPARARALAGAIVDRFVRPDGAVVTTTDVETLIVPAVDQRDQYAPSGTSAAYALLARLGRTEPRYAEAARKILARMAPRIEAAPDRWASFTASAALLADAVPPPLASTHDSATRVKATASAQRQGDGGEIVVTLAIEPGYHLNANPASFDYLVPTRVIVAGVAGAHIVYPPGKPFKPRFVTDDLSVYEGSVTIRIELTTKEIGAMPVSSVAVEVQACDLQTCLEPATIVVPLAK